MNIVVNSRLDTVTLRFLKKNDIKIEFLENIPLHRVFAHAYPPMQMGFYQDSPGRRGEGGVLHGVSRMDNGEEEEQGMETGGDGT